MPNLSYTIQGRQYDTGYYLADGIYPNYAVFVKTISNPVGRKKYHFAQRQESVRKDVERAFGILKSRWAIIGRPSKLWSVDAMNVVIKTCIILHNMILEDERGKNLTIDYQVDRSVDNDVYSAPSVEQLVARMRVIESPQQHYTLRNDLIDHLWELYGQLE